MKKILLIRFPGKKLPQPGQNMPLLLKMTTCINTFVSVFLCCIVFEEIVI